MGQWLRPRLLGAPFLPMPHRVGGPSSQSCRLQRWTLSTSLGTLVLSECYNSPPRPQAVGPLHRLTFRAACLSARRVHVEPRPPNIEESSEFSRTPAGKDGIRQGRNVPSPPRALEARAHNATVLSTCWSLALDRLVWEQPSASIRLYAQKCLLEGQMLS
jgi:hypothetical protein